VRARAHLDVVAARPHRTGSRANESVRAYLVRTLDALGYLGPNRGEPESYGEETPAGSERPQTKPAYGPEGQP
jgi:hypothetical protein